MGQTFLEPCAGLSMGGFFPPRIEAHQASNQHRQEKLPANSLDDGKPARDIAARYDIAVAERCQCYKTKIHRAGEREIPGESETSGPDLFKNPVEAAKKDPRQQISAESSVDVLAVDRPSAKSEAQRAARRNQSNHRPNHAACRSERCLEKPAHSEAQDQCYHHDDKQKPPLAAPTHRNDGRKQIGREKQLD